MSAPLDQPGHRHGRTCYWDHRICGWVCPAPPPAPVEPEVEVVDAGPRVVAEHLPA